jgi:hypothetical protein
MLQKPVHHTSPGGKNRDPETQGYHYLTGRCSTLKRASGQRDQDRLPKPQSLAHICTTWPKPPTEWLTDLTQQTPLHRWHLHRNTLLLDEKNVVHILGLEKRLCKLDLPRNFKNANVVVECSRKCKRPDTQKQ